LEGVAGIASRAAVAIVAGGARRKADMPTDARRTSRAGVRRARVSIVAVDRIVPARARAGVAGIDRAGIIIFAGRASDLRRRRGCHHRMNGNTTEDEQAGEEQDEARTESTTHRESPLRLAARKTLLTRGANAE